MFYRWFACSLLFRKLLACFLYEDWRLWLWVREVSTVFTLVWPVPRPPPARPEVKKVFSRNFLVRRFSVEWHAGIAIRPIPIPNIYRKRVSKKYGCTGKNLYALLTPMEARHAKFKWLRQSISGSALDWRYNLISKRTWGPTGPSDASLWLKLTSI